MNYDRHKSIQVTRSCTNLSPRVWRDRQNIHRDQEFSPTEVLLRPWRSGLAALVGPRRVEVSGCCSVSWTWISELSFPRWFGRDLSLKKRVIPGTWVRFLPHYKLGFCLQIRLLESLDPELGLNASHFWNCLYSDKKQPSLLLEEGIKVYLDQTLLNICSLQ